MGEIIVSTAWDRFWAKVDKTETCWNWTAARVQGYGHFMLTSRPNRRWLAHRLSYTWLVGPIPEGLELDHLCRNPSCVRPDHLDPVTSGENTRRSPIHDEWQRSKTHCPQGHPYSGDNLYVYGNRRACVICRRRAAREFAARKRARTSR